MWVVHVGTLVSSWFILAANSWMQHPVGYRYNPDTGRAELIDFAAVMFNKVQLVTFPHVVLAAYMTAARSWSASPAGSTPRASTPSDREVHRKAIRLGAAVALVAGLGVAVSGDFQGKVMTEVQPMKMAAAEALYETEETCAPFSVLHHRHASTAARRSRAFTIPCLLSFLATGTLRRAGRGHQRPARAVRRGVRQRPGCGLLRPRRLRAEHPRHLLVASGCMIGLGMARRRSARRWSCG